MKAEPTNPHNERFLVRRDGNNILFVPITMDLQRRNMHTLETTMTFKVNAKKKVAELVHIAGELCVKHGEQTQPLKEFEARTADDLFQKVAEWAGKHLYSLTKVGPAVKGVT